MKIELKNLKINLAFSEETTQFKADLYIDGVKVGYASNDGQGGCTFYNPNSADTTLLVSKAEAYCKALPPTICTYGDKEYNIPMNLEGFIDEIVEKECQKKETAKHLKKLQNNMLKGVCIGTPENYSVITWKGHTIASIKATPAGLMTLNVKVKQLIKQGETILNTNLN